MSKSNIEDFLNDIQLVSHEQFEIVSAIREIFLDANPNLVEKIKYGGLTFSLSSMLCGGIYSYKSHVSVEFSNGVGFSDPEYRLEGGGQWRRHVKIRSKADIENSKVAFFINQAVRE